NKLPTPPLKVYSNLGNITKLSKPPKPKRAKRKKKKKLPKRRPGHRHSEQSAAPSIVLGKRSNSSSSSSSSGTTRSPLPNLTQLEKPHMPATSATIFSEEPFVRSQGVLQLPRLQRQRRALPTPTAAARPVSSGRRRSGGGGRRRSSNNGRVPRRGKSAAPPPPVDSKTPSSGYKVPLAVHLLHPKRNQSHAARRRSGEGFDLFEFIGGEDEEEEDAEESAYYDEPATSAAKPENSSSSAEEEADFGALEPNSSTIAAPLSSTENVEREQLPSKKRIRRRPVRRPDRQNAAEYYDDDDDIDVVDESEEEYKDADNDSDSDSMSDSSFGNFFRMLFYPMQLAMTRLYDGLTGQSEEEPTLPDKPKYPTYTLYHSAHSNEALLAEKQQTEEDEDDDDSSLSSWFSSWFGLRRRNKRIDSNAVVALPTPTPTPEPEPSWFESWFGFGKTTASTETEEEAEEQDDYDKWFAGWFESTPKPKSRRRKATTTTTTTSSTTSTTTLATPQVPILTIVDPMRNPQNWIGILAHHIVNSTANGAAQIATSTINPLKQLVSQAPAVATAEDKRISYDKYQIWRLKPQDEPQVRALEQFKKGEDGNKLQWLKGPSLRGLTDVLVPPKMLVDFQGTLNFEGIAHEVLIFDVGKAIAYERNKEAYMLTTPTAVRRRPVKQQAEVAATMSWNKYHEHDDILKYLETLRMRHAQLVELIHIGRSYEGRPLLVVKIESKQLAAAAIAAAASSHKRLKHKRRSGQANAVFIEAGAQAMAWIGPASATWMISELVRLMRSNKTDEQHEFIRNTTWYIMPVLNPDGYVYSHEYDRFWKKSRSQHAEKPPSGLLDSAMTWLQQKRANAKNCFGVDLDRNWLYQWGKRGSSKTPCNEFYAGPAPFSEPETKAVSEFLMDYRTQIKLYISLQAYGQVLSYPIKANSTFNTERLDDFLDVAMVGTDVLRKKGSKTRYKVDSANDLIEQRSGCADAFAAYEIGIPFSYTLQLADNGVHGYLLPSSAIESTARDAFEIIGGMLDYI
ncbi:CG8945, partial [Drosophila busckii]